MPEFLAEGCAIHNLVNPDRIVVGTAPNANGMAAFELLKDLYTHINTKFFHVKTASSELGKLVANAMLAQRISSINSVSELCEITDACISDISSIVGSDRRIGPLFLQSSPGFGGSCFEKDILSLIYILESNGLKEAAEYWAWVLHMNNHQKKRLAEKIVSKFTDPSSTVISIFGFAFKKNTSDARMTPIAYLVNHLIEKGFTVKIHDPKATERIF